MYLERVDRKDLPSYFPDYGAIFMASEFTREECLGRKLFGLPLAFKDFVLRVKIGMLLFLFDYHKRKLYGVFEASTDGALDLVPDAFESANMRFPAQVWFNVYWECAPLPEDAFRDAIAENYFAPNKFNFGLSRDQVDRLLFLFESTKLKIQRPHMSQISCEKQNKKLRSVRKHRARSLRRVKSLYHVDNIYQNPRPKNLASITVFDTALPLLEPAETKVPLQQFPGLQNYYSTDVDEEIDDNVQVPSLYFDCSNPDSQFSALPRRQDHKDDDRIKSRDIRSRGLDPRNRDKCISVFYRLSGWPKVIEGNGRRGPCKHPSRPDNKESGSSSENMRDTCKTEASVIITGDAHDDDELPDPLDMLVALYNDYLSRSRIDDQMENVSRVDGNVKLKDLTIKVEETS